MTASKYVFGPVPSRRLGRSLGVDCIPFKTCSYDCIYCQLGRTTLQTLERKEWVPFDDIVGEIGERLSSRPDYITLSGSGEPALYSRVGELIERVRSMTDIPVAVLTNGSFLWNEEVRRQLSEAHLVIPSLDAGDEAMFRAVNRPCPELEFARVMDGLAEFRRVYPGEMWLEIFILGGYTSLRDEVAKLADCVVGIAPDRVQLNTVTRPPAEDYAVKVPFRKLREIAGMFTPHAEVIADYRHVSVTDGFSATREQVLQAISRRPCTVEDIASGLGIHRNEALKHIGDLVGRKLIEEATSGGRRYYRCPCE